MSDTSELCDGCGRDNLRCDCDNNGCNHMWRDRQDGGGRICMWCGTIRLQRKTQKVASGGVAQVEQNTRLTSYQRSDNMSDRASDEFIADLKLLADAALNEGNDELALIAYELWRYLTSESTRG